MKNLNRIFKVLSWALAIVGVVIVAIGLLGNKFPKSVADGNDGLVNTLLMWAYIMLGIAVACIIIFGIGIKAASEPKSLIKLLIGLVAAVAIVAIVYALAPASPAVGLQTPATHGELKLTDTILILTYIFGGAAILAIIVGEIMSAVRNK